jgi:hypothetical protein
MDAATVRKHLAEITTQLGRNEDEHEVLISLQRGYEGWLRLNPEASPAPAPTPPMAPMFDVPPMKRGKPVGSVSFRGAVLQILRDARGEPLNVREILPRALALGAATNAKNPLGAVDLMAHSLKRSHPVEKVGPRTWRYGAAKRDGAPM